MTPGQKQRIEEAMTQTYWLVGLTSDAFKDMDEAICELVDEMVADAVTEALAKQTMTRGQYIAVQQAIADRQDPQGAP